MLFLIYEKRSLVKLCDLGLSTEQSFCYIIEDKKKNQWEQLDVAWAASMLRAHPLRSVSRPG